jgi:hypothetical protein
MLARSPRYPGRRVLVLAAVVLLSPAFALTPHAQAQKTGASKLPTHGIFIPGVKLAGIKLGFTQTQVTAVLGKNYTLCTPANSANLCKEPVLLYEYTRGEPLGLAVRLHKGKVGAVFTLGAVPGWKTPEGLQIYDEVTKIYKLYPAATTYTKCVGFEAVSMTRGSVTSSFYTASGVVYGFALTAPSEKVCQ